MDYLGALRMFVRAVEVGSFSKAAIATNTKTSTVSRAIAGLEEDLGVSLFHRTTRRAHLTEPGATFYEHARGVLRGLEEARDAASAMEGRPQGLIRLHVPGGFARLHIMPFVSPSYVEIYGMPKDEEDIRNNHRIVIQDADQTRAQQMYDKYAGRDQVGFRHAVAGDDAGRRRHSPRRGAFVPGAVA